MCTLYTTWYITTYEPDVIKNNHTCFTCNWYFKNHTSKYLMALEQFSFVINNGGGLDLLHNSYILPYLRTNKDDTHNYKCRHRVVDQFSKISVPCPGSTTLNALKNEINRSNEAHNHPPLSNVEIVSRKYWFIQIRKKEKKTVEDSTDSESDVISETSNDSSSSSDQNEDEIIVVQNNTEVQVENVFAVIQDDRTYFNL